MKKLILSAAICLSLASCSTYRKAVDAANNNQAFISPIVTLVVTTIFEKAVSAEDKRIKAEIVSNIADKILSADFVSKPGKDEIVALIKGSIPSEKTHWLILANSIGDIYEKYTKNLTDSDITGSVSVLKNIASGLKVATSTYNG